MPRRSPEINYRIAADGKTVRLGHGKDCIALMICDPVVKAGVVLTPDEARAIARALRAQAHHAETATEN
jgi:hypothetical protein